jgi:hypothetical protein
MAASMVDWWTLRRGQPAPPGVPVMLMSMRLGEGEGEKERSWLLLRRASCSNVLLSIPQQALAGSTRPAAGAAFPNQPMAAMESLSGRLAIGASRVEGRTAGMLLLRDARASPRHRC